MVSDEDPDAPFLECLNHLLNFPDGDGVNASEELVQKDEFGIERQGPGDLDSAPLTPRKGESTLLGDRIDMELIQETLQALPTLPVRKRQGFKHGQDVFFDGHASED